MAPRLLADARPREAALGGAAAPRGRRRALGPPGRRALRHARGSDRRRAGADQRTALECQRQRPCWGRRRGTRRTGRERRGERRDLRSRGGGRGGRGDRGRGGRGLGEGGGGEGGGG